MIDTSILDHPCILFNQYQLFNITEALEKLQLYIQT